MIEYWKGYFTGRLLPILVLLVTWILVSVATTKSTLDVEDAFSAFSAKEARTMNWQSLGEFYEERILALMPTPGHVYNIPSFQTLRDMETVVDRMMDLTAKDLPTRCPRINLLSLNDVYEIGVFEDVGFANLYCILLTRSSDSPWGTVIVNPIDALHVRKNISVDCPHPLHDINTGEQSVAVFQGINARSLLISGAYRYASNETSCQGGSFRISDAAHSIQHGFHAAVTAISKHYQRQNAIDFTAIQLHGMGSSTCKGVDAYLTHGMASVQTEPNKKVFILWNKIVSSFVRINNATFVLLPSSGTFSSRNSQSLSCSMSGSSNIQGRLLNGVSPDQVCTTAASSVSGRFIHLEQKPWLRDSRLFHVWVEVLNQAYDAFLETLPVAENVK